MLNADQNQQLMRVGAGTPMGELLRRYWMPFVAAAELDERPIKPIRLLGEDLVVYKDRSGSYGLLDRYCPHRGADRAHGIVEQTGMRCAYHGWQFDSSGTCLSMPFEDRVNPEARFRDKVRSKAYPVQEKAGLLWAYMGPQPAPLIPDWEFFHTQGHKQIVLVHLRCNWFHCQENSVDPVHTEWLHDRWSYDLHGGASDVTPPSHVRVGFEEFEYGFRWRRQLDGEPEDDPHWAVGRLSLWPNAFFPGPINFIYNVPIDDEHTLQIYWLALRGHAVDQPQIPHWYAPYVDPLTEPWVRSYVQNQDFICFVGQGTSPDRTREHLAESDRGVIMMRKRFLAEMKVVAEGGEPKGVLRDPDKNVRIPLPAAEVRYGRRHRGIASQQNEIGYDGMIDTFLPYGVPADLRQQVKEFLAERMRRWLKNQAQKG